MEPFNTLYNELISFLGINAWLQMFKSGDYSSLATLDGFTSAMGPLIPFLLIIELIRGIIYKRFAGGVYKVNFFIYVFNDFIGKYISIGATIFFTGVFEKYAPFTTTFTWYWLIYAYIVWELSHFVYHYLGHKIRLFWCLHSTHHAPDAMNLSVTYAHFFLEGAYASMIRTSICIILGVNPVMLGFIMFIDGTWGALIHVGENLLKNARLGFLEKLILTPSHHRVHHARNPLYMDTNFCNLLNIWDRVFGTLRHEREDMPPEYGITRPMNPHNFWDAYFGEIICLAKDVYHAPGIKNKIAYIFMAPGWSHTGDHKTAKIVKQQYLQTKQPLSAATINN